MERRSLLWRVQHWETVPFPPNQPVDSAAAFGTLAAGLHTFMARRSLWQPRDTPDLLLLTLAAVAGVAVDLLWLRFTQS